MEHPALLIVMRYLHIVSAIIFVGGYAFILFCLSPACRLLDENFRASLDTLIQKRFTRVIWASFIGLLISGGYNWIINADVYKDIGPAANALIGTKFLLAVAIFALIWARSIGIIKLADKAAMMIYIHLAAVVILLAVILRYLRLDHRHALIAG